MDRGGNKIYAEGGTPFHITAQWVYTPLHVVHGYIEGCEPFSYQCRGCTHVFKFCADM